MKKYILYIGILAIGLLLGWFIFGNAFASKTTHNHPLENSKNQQWTCSMHPQIMQPEAGDCPLCGMDLIPAAAGADGLSTDQFKLTKNAMALANVQTSIIGKHTPKNASLKLSGAIVENETKNATQVSYFSGRIEKLHINFTGEKVHQGQLLATIYSPELFAAQQELITAASTKESQPALYKAVRNKLKLWKLTEKQINKIETSGKVLENFPVYATISGTVSKMLVAQGDYIKQGQPLLKIANLNTVWANFDIYENQINLFKKGQNIEISTNAHPNKKINGKVSFINPVLNTQTRTVTLRAVLNNKSAFFKPGMFVKGQVTLAKKGNKKPLTIPASAVLWTGKRAVVYVKTKPSEPIFEMREVSLGNRQGENYEISEGLKSGDEIVTNGTFTVDAAAQLQGKKSMMNKDGGEVMTGHEGHSNVKTTSNNTVSSAVNKRVKVSTKFQKQLKVVFENYITLKNTLVNDNAKTANIAANTMLKNISKVDMKLLVNNTTHTLWMDIEKALKISTHKIANTNNIKTQRELFITLSKSMTKAVEIFGVNKKIYQQFCPMANSDKGAFWLSTEKNIKNPYFGEAMLQCGSVTSIIK